jgi:hypothetical protein
MVDKIAIKYMYHYLAKSRSTVQEFHVHGYLVTQKSGSSIIAHVRRHVGLGPYVGEHTVTTKDLRGSIGQQHVPLSLLKAHINKAFNFFSGKVQSGHTCND